MRSHVSFVAAIVLAGAPLACAGTRGPNAALDVVESERALRQLEDTWAAAYVAHDSAALAPILADDFVMSRANAEMWSKADYLAHVANDTRTHASITRADERYRVYGDAAVVTYRPTRLTGGTPYVFRSTDTFVRRDGRWQLVARHITQIPRPGS